MNLNYDPKNHMYMLHTRVQNLLAVHGSKVILMLCFRHHISLLKHSLSISEVQHTYETSTYPLLENGNRAGVAFQNHLESSKMSNNLMHVSKAKYHANKMYCCCLKLKQC